MSLGTTTFTPVGEGSRPDTPPAMDGRPVEDGDALLFEARPCTVWRGNTAEKLRTFPIGPDPTCG